MPLLGLILLWFFSLYYACKDEIQRIFLVLRIKMRNYDGLITKNAVHLAIRVNDVLKLEHAAIVQLISHIRSSYDVKYLTIISEKSGLDLSIYTEIEDVVVFYNYCLVSPTTRMPVLSVNVIDKDSRDILLQKWNDTLFSDYKITDFPPIDLFLTMNHTLDFRKLLPLHIGFTHFYTCPVNATCSFSPEAIAYGFEKYSMTKQNFGK